MKREALYHELDAIAPQQLEAVLEAWPELTGEQTARLLEVLRAELAPDGLLSAEHGRRKGFAHDRAQHRRVRRQALAVVERGAL